MKLLRNLFYSLRDNGLEDCPPIKGSLGGEILMIRDCGNHCGYGDCDCWDMDYGSCECVSFVVVKVDLVGGYYDAGDNVKFGFPMAFTRTLLAWSMIEFGSSMQKEVENVRNAIRWSIDYLLKAHTITPHTLYVQVSC
ncbi:hypothetical protein Lal_00044797, partial [Lupinus albus]